MGKGERQKLTHLFSARSKLIICSEQVLERQIAQRDSITSGTTMAVQSLDQKNMAGIGDLRGRVARYAHFPPKHYSEELYNYLKPSPDAQVI